MTVELRRVNIEELSNTDWMKMCAVLINKIAPGQTVSVDSNDVNAIGAKVIVVEHHGSLVSMSVLSREAAEDLARSAANPN